MNVRSALKNILVLAGIWLSFTVSVYADDVQLAKLFDDRGVTGTIIIASLDATTVYIHNDARAHQGFLPASTFKIPNTLIALDEGALKDEKEIIAWDGTDKGRAEWNKDHSLATAFPASCVWFYQALAERIGAEKYARHLRALKYGNQETGPQVNSFWLDGDIRISALEQVDLLRKLVTEKLPYKHEHIRVLKQIMSVETTPRYCLRAKTGWVSQVGWYVGYIETSGMVYLFAMNMDITKLGEEKYRQEITREALTVKHIW